MYIDTHCHISKNDFENIEEIINNIGNNIAIVSGYNDSSNREVIELINKYPNLYGTIGIHPSEIDESLKKSIEFIEKNVNNPKIVGIGEIGLDYHFGKENSEKQKEVFIKQIEMALKYNKPIVIHSRDASLETLEIIRKYPDIKKVMHCYSYSLEIAKELIKNNVLLGIGGVLTFKNSRVLKEVVEQIDLKYLLLETDSPFLAPEPFRGTKNEPKNVLLVAEKMAELKKIEVNMVLSETTNNAIRQFDLPL